MYMEKTPIRLFEAFSGYGSQLISCKKIFNVIKSDCSDIDPTAIRAYTAIHGEISNLGDITKVPTLDGYDIVTYSFPCQDLSSQGNRAGLTGAKSGLVYAFLAALKRSKELPRVLLMENVTGLLSVPGFSGIIDELTTLGYKSTYKVLDSSEFGVPQRRKRVFMVSVLGEKYFQFPVHVPVPIVMPKPIWLLPVQPTGDLNLAYKGSWVGTRFDSSNRVGVGWVPTICKSNRQSLQGCVKFEHGGKAYGLTAYQACLMMGLTRSDYIAFRTAGLTVHKVYSVCGNSIVVNVLDYIFEAIDQQVFRA